MSLDTLLNLESQAKSLAQIISRASDPNFVVKVSPVDALLELFTDLSLVLADCWQTSGRTFRSLNPDVVPQGERIPSSEAEPNEVIKIIKRLSPRVIENPELANFFRQLASLGVLLKKNPNRSFMDLIRASKASVKEFALKKEKNRSPEVHSKDQAPERSLKAKRDAFHRRQREKRRSEPMS